MKPILFRKISTFLILGVYLINISNFSLSARDIHDLNGGENRETKMGKNIKDEDKKSEKYFDKKRDISKKYSGKKLQKVKDSFRKNGGYKVIIQSNKSLEELQNNFGNEESVQIEKVGKSMYLLQVGDYGELAKSFSEIDNGYIPETLSGETVIEPEVFELASNNNDIINELGNEWYNQKYNIDALQSELKSAPAISVGVLDTGIDSTHSEFEGRIDTGLSKSFIEGENPLFDIHGHGTQVAGIIGANQDGNGIYGVNSHANIASLKVLDNSGIGTSYEVIEAIKYAKEHSIQVLNMSFGGGGDPINSLLCSAISDAKSAGVIVVVSAGNTGNNVSNTIPGGCPDAITVASINASGVLAPFSNYGSGIDVYAPGVNIQTTALHNSYTSVNGTSFSAPIISGYISAMMALGRNIDLSHFILSQDISSVTASGEIISQSGVFGTGGGMGAGSSKVEDYTNYRYYSGTFLFDGKLYGNSLYSPEFSFSGADLQDVEIYTYQQYQDLLSKNAGKMSVMSASANGLIGYWSLDGTANDTSGNGNHGTPTNVTWEDGGFGNGRKVASFNGVSSKIVIPRSSTIEPSVFTISAWIKTSQAAGYAPIFRKGDTFYHGYLLALASGKGLYFVGTNTDNIAYTPSSINNNVYKLITMTYGGAGTPIRGFINGVQVVTGSILSSNPVYDVGTLTIGWDDANDNYWFNGKIADVRVYNRVLTNTEISDMYAYGAPEVASSPGTNVPEVSDYLKKNPLAKFDPKSIDSYQSLLTTTIKKSGPTELAEEQSKGDPVNLATGEFDYSNTLMQIPGVGLPYELKVAYKNQTVYNGVLGYNWTHNYNLSLSGETNGNIIFFDGNLASYRFLSNGTGGFLYNPGIRATLASSGTEYILQYDSGKQYTFSASKKVSKIRDIHGNSLSFTYTGAYLSGVTDTLGRTIAYSYYDHGRLKTVTDFNGRVAEFVYFTGATASGTLYDLKEIQLKNGTGTKVIAFEYTTTGDDTSKHNITRLVDAKGQAYVTNTYENDRVKTQQYGTGTITYTYTLSGSDIVTNSVLDRAGNRVDYLYDAQGLNTETRYYSGGTYISYTDIYSGGYIVEKRYPLGNGWKYSYDARGNIIEKRQKAIIANPDTASDRITTLTYNTRNQLLSSELVGQAKALRTYTASGDLATETLSGIVDASGASYTTVRSYTYNSSGQLTSSIDARGVPTTYTYLSGLLVSTTTGTGGSARTINMSYNPYGQILSLTDAKGNITSYTLTPWDQKASETRPEGLRIEYEYDANGNTTRTKEVFTGGTREILTTYNSLDKPTLIRSEYAPGQYLDTRLVYDAADRIIEKQVGTGAKTNYTYNSFGKVTSEQRTLDASHIFTTSYTYDTNGNITTKTDPLGNSITYTLDGYDAITRETRPLGGYTIYTYNIDGTIATTSTYSASGILLGRKSTTYNLAGKVLQESHVPESSSMSGALTTTYGYDSENHLIRETDPKGNTTISDYTPFGEVGSITDPMGNKKEFTYDANGNITLEKTLPSTGTGITTITRTYDRENRLLSATPINTGSINQNTESYVYDKTGNRRTNTNTSTYTTNTLNQYTIRIIPITLMVKLVS